MVDHKYNTLFYKNYEGYVSTQAKNKWVNNITVSWWNGAVNCKINGCGQSM